MLWTMLAGIVDAYEAAPLTFIIKLRDISTGNPLLGFEAVLSWSSLVLTLCC